MFLRIQVLRLVAAVLVVAYHAQLTALSYFGGSMPYPLLDLGSYGVDLFFVISGFIIVFIGSSREKHAAVFAKRRFQRVVPLYWIVTTLTFVLTHIPGLARNNVSGTLHLVQSFFFLSWLNGAETYPVLNVGWTLEYEIFFYAIAAIAMALTPRPWLATAFAILILVLTGQGTSFFLQNPIILEFVFGMTIGAYLYDRRSFPWMLAGTALVLATLPVSGAAWRVWMFGLPFSGVVALAIYADLHKKYVGTILPELGNASFSIYLVHVIAISCVCKLGVIVVPRMPVAVIIPVITLLAIVAGYILYRLVEKKLIVIFHRRRATVAVRALEPVV
ncbi:acyltransferase [Sphingomonas faeni]|nr:acyltransferase [Sphingomonas faeni]MCK8458454.1 acyltransferase [Sphingomonas faeni]